MSIRDDYRITPAARRARSVTMEFFDDGRPLEEIRREKEERITSEGVDTPASVWRIEMIRGLDLRPREWGAPTGEPAKSVIMLGCYPLSGIQEIMAYGRLLQRLGERYTFLTKEYCCGAPMMMLTAHRGDKAGRGPALETARELVGMNIAEARRLGAEAMYYPCPWCAYVARRFYSDCDVQQRYYADHIVDLVKERQPHLRLDAEVGYYPGCQAKRLAFAGQPDADWDWKAYRETLGTVEGLRIKDIPRYCCATDWQRVSDYVEKKNVDTTVMPCWACKGMFNYLKPDLPRQGFAEILLEALQA